VSRELKKQSPAAVEGSKKYNWFCPLCGEDVNETDESCPKCHAAFVPIAEDIAKWTELDRLRVQIAAAEGRTIS